MVSPKSARKKLSASRNETAVTSQTGEVTPRKNPASKAEVLLGKKPRKATPSASEIPSVPQDTPAPRPRPASPKPSTSKVSSHGRKPATDESTPETEKL